MKLTRLGKNKVDLREWNFPSIENINSTIEDAIKAAASEAIDIALEEYEWRFSFPAEYGPDSDGRGGPAPLDPMTIAVGIPLGDEIYGDVEFQCSLRNIVQEIITDHENGGRADAAISGSSRDSLNRIANGFHGLAEMLELALARPESTEAA